MRGAAHGSRDQHLLCATLPLERSTSCTPCAEGQCSTAAAVRDLTHTCNQRNGLLQGHCSNGFDTQDDGAAVQGSLEC